MPTPQQYPNTIYTMEAANLFCSNLGVENQPGFTTHLMLQELKLPGLEENFVDFLPAGSPVATEVKTHVNRLECTFTLNGWQPSIQQLIFPSSALQKVYTAYGVIRDHRTGRANKAEAIMYGRLGRVNPTAYRKGDLMQHEYSIRSITHYELRMESNPGSGVVDAGTTTMLEIYRWDFFENTFIVGNTDVTAAENRILGINVLTLGA